MQSSSRRSSRPSNNAARRMSAVMIQGAPVLIADENFQAAVPTWDYASPIVQPTEQQRQQEECMLGWPAPPEAELLKLSVQAAKHAAQSKELMADLLDEVKVTGTKKTVESSVDRSEFEAWRRGRAWEYVDGCGPGSVRWLPGSPYYKGPPTGVHSQQGQQQHQQQKSAQAGPSQPQHQHTAQPTQQQQQPVEVIELVDLRSTSSELEVEEPGEQQQSRETGSISPGLGKGRRGPVKRGTDRMPCGGTAPVSDQSLPSHLCEINTLHSVYPRHLIRAYITIPVVSCCVLCCAVLQKRPRMRC